MSILTHLLYNNNLIYLLNFFNEQVKDKIIIFISVVKTNEFIKNKVKI